MEQWRGYTTLHRATQPNQFHQFMSSVPPVHCSEFLALKDKRGWSTLHRVAWRDNVEVAHCVLHAAANQDERDCLLECRDRDGKTPLFWLQSKAMVHLFLDTISEHRRQQYIMQRDFFYNENAIHWAALHGQHEIVKAIFEHCHQSTLKELLHTREDLWGYRLLLSACQGGDERTVMDLIDLFADHGLLDSALEDFSNRGDTVLHYLVIHQLIDALVEILRGKPTERIRQLLLMKNDRGDTPKDLAMIPLREYHHKQVDFYIKFSDLPTSLSNKMIRLLHVLSNEFSFDSPGVLIQCEMNSALKMKSVLWQRVTASGFSTLQVT